jgi:hypothetical protein
VSDVLCPITFTTEEEQESLRLDGLERKAAEQLQGSMEMLRLGPEGRLSCDDFGAAKEAITRMEEMCQKQAETKANKIAIRDHWVYDDLDEEYL